MTLNEIKDVIESAIPDAQAHIFDPMNDGQHLQAVVVSPSFEGMMLIKQHKLVMTALKEALKEEVHAMGLKTFTPAKWEESRAQFGL